MDIKTKRWMNIMEFAQCTGCHQRADRSFFFRSWQFPVCARCTGVIIGQISSCLFFRKLKNPFKTSFFCCGVMFLDWFLQQMKIKESTNSRRLITGTLGGFGLNVLYLSVGKVIFTKLFSVDKQL